MRFSRLNTVNERRLFDPNVKEDLMELKYFLKNSKWKDGCPFFLEESWEDVPAMCKDRYTRFMLEKVK